MNISYMCFSVHTWRGELAFGWNMCVFHGMWWRVVCRGVGWHNNIIFLRKKRRSPFPRVVEGFRFLNLVMILIRYLNTCKKRLGKNLMVCKKAPAIFSSRLQFAKTLFCKVGGWLVSFKAIVFLPNTDLSWFSHIFTQYVVYNHHLPFLHPKLDIVHTRVCIGKKMFTSID